MIPEAIGCYGPASKHLQNDLAKKGGKAHVIPVILVATPLQKVVASYAHNYICSSLTHYDMMCIILRSIICYHNSLSHMVCPIPQVTAMKHQDYPLEQLLL